MPGLCLNAGSVAFCFIRKRVLRNAAQNINANIVERFFRIMHVPWAAFPPGFMANIMFAAANNLIVEGIFVKNLVQQDCNKGGK